MQLTRAAQAHARAHSCCILLAAARSAQTPNSRQGKYTRQRTMSGTGSTAPGRPSMTTPTSRPRGRPEPGPPRQRGTHPNFSSSLRSARNGHEMNAPPPSVPEGAAPLQTHATSWDPADARLALSITLNASLVPSVVDGGRLRFDAGHIAVLDDFLDPASVESIRVWLGIEGASPTPTGEKWERSTADDATGARTWGLKAAALRQLEASPPTGVVEFNSRIVKLFPGVHIVHQFVQQGAEHRCERFVANAACVGDHFSWHVDADPSTLPPPSGGYVNREKGRPLYVSALLYLDTNWPDDFDGETLFLDSSGTGIFVRPRHGRVVLMDQDVPHRLSPPSSRAGRPRYSLVWKLMFIPRTSTERCCISRPEWGRPTPFGSDARAVQLSKALQQDKQEQTLSGTKRRAEEPPMTEPGPKGDGRRAIKRQASQMADEVPRAKRHSCCADEMQTDAA